MWFLKKTSPKEIPNQKTDWDWRVKAYHWLLTRLLPVYKRSALSDTIDLGTVQIIHNVRDYWYERELQRYGIKTTPQMELQQCPFHIQRKYHRSHLFNWEESLLIFSGDKSYNIKRKKHLSIDTEIKGVLKTSLGNDIIFRSIFSSETTMNKTAPHKVENQKTDPTPNNQDANNNTKSSPNIKISIKDTIPSKEPETQIQHNTAKHQGFEENNAF